MTSAARPIRVLIADDHPVVRRGMSALLTSLAGVDVVAEAATGEEALREAQLSRPDVVVMDIRMPAMDGVEATRRLTALLPDVAVLVVTMYEDDETVLSALRAGARGYLLKGAQQEEILTTIRSVATGQFVIAPGVAARLLGQVGPPPRPADPFPELTAREREILDRVARGHGNARVAAELALAVKTVANHLSAIFAKLGVSGRTEAILLARERGLGDDASGPAS
ncbi:response regulator transcription factor [Streptomyces sp. 6-11-2]|uniref:response regulator transcription factor n=1 Tax=unclassified Streptomyces TaxID=2593676 RepID=UPI00114231F6|nr:response regulator transcription factor [Streptomyces sp. 6-11-2]GED90183.1 DNA-binding response regulator [Streptomyces sp. 6-11-2]